MVFTDEDMVPYKENIEKYRQLLKVEVAKNPELYCEEDLKQIDIDSGITIFRVLKTKKNKMKDSLAYGLRTLRWRKKAECTKITPADFPAEFADYGALHMYFGDKFGNLLVVLNLKDHNKKYGEADHIRKFFMYYGEKLFHLDRYLQGTLILNLEGASIKQVEMRLVTEFLDVFRTYYCEVFAHIIVLGMSWVYEGMYKIIRPLMPEEFRHKLVFVHDIPTLEKYVNLDDVEEAVMGRRKFDPPPTFANYERYVEKVVKDRRKNAENKL